MMSILIQCREAYLFFGLLFLSVFRSLNRTSILSFLLRRKANVLIGLTILNVSCSPRRSIEVEEAPPSQNSNGILPVENTDTDIEQVEARLTGQPFGAASEELVVIAVNDVFEYQYKAGKGTDIDCDSDESYSAFVSSSKTIEVEISNYTDTKADITVCVIGRNGIDVQFVATEVTWTWDPAMPKSPTEMSLVDGHNQVTGAVTSEENVIVVRGPSSSTWLPESGQEYSLGETIDDVTVVSVEGLEFTDSSINNGETWTYFSFSMSQEKTYSSPFKKELSLAPQELIWVNKLEAVADGKYLEPINERWVCRVGPQAGRVYSETADPSDGTCAYALNDSLLFSTDYELLGANKGDPLELIEYMEVTLDDEGRLLTVVDPGKKFISGEEDNNGQKDEMYICLSYSDEEQTIIDSFGKAGKHFGDGCHQQEDAQGVFATNLNYRLLVKK